jgi:hypothetical protein
LIARGQIQLPTPILIDAREEYRPFAVDLGSYQATVYPPYRSELADYPSDLPLLERPRYLGRPDSPRLVPGLQMNGSEVIEADVLQMDFVADNFDRRLDPPADDPPVSLFFAVANRFLGCFRTLGRSFQSSYVLPEKGTWHIEYLDDDGNTLPANPVLFRRRSGSHKSTSLLGLPRTLWDRIGEMPTDFQSPVADELLLDATASLPHIGTALVLAFTALEVRIDSALNELASLHGIRPELWGWVNDRGDYRKEPSIGERYDLLLKAITGRTLKTDKRLWEAFSNLRDARNSFIHDGVAIIGKGTPVTEAKAHELLQAAVDITDWVETILPATSRRPKYEGTTTFEDLIPMLGPSSSSGD